MDLGVSALIPLGAFCGFLILIVMVAWRSFRRRVNQLFIWYVFLLAAWAFGSFMVYANFPGVSSFVWNSFLIVPLMAASVAFFHFVRVFLRKSEPLLWLSLGYGLCLIFAIAAALGYSVSYAYWEEGVYHLELGIATFLMTPVALSFVGGSIVNLVQGYRRTKDPFIRNRIFYPLVGITIAGLLSLTNFLPGWKWYPVDQAGNLFNAILISYAVARYRLLDVSIVLRRGFLYSTLTMLIVAVFFLVALFLQSAFNAQAGQTFWVLAVIMALIIAAVFRPVHGFAQRWIDRLFYREAYDYRRTLRTSSQKMSTMLDLEELAEWLVNNLMVTMGAAKGGLFLLDKDTERYITIVLKGYDDPAVNKMQLRADNPVVRRLTQGNACLTGDDIDRLPQLRSLWKSERGQLKQLEAAVVVPLKAKADVIGIVVLGPKMSEEPYSFDDLELLLTVANQAVVAVENARLYQQAKDAAERTAVLNELTRILGSSLNIEQVFQAFTVGAKKLVDFDQASINLVDEKEQKVRVLALSGETPSRVEGGDVLPLKGSGTEWVALNKRACIEGDLTQERRFPLDDLLIEQGFRSTVRLPLISKDRVFGTFSLRSRRLYAYGEDDLKILEQISAQLAVAIENARLYEETRRAYEELKAAQDYMVQSEKLRALGEMAGGVAHDFNNILAVILGRAQLALEDANEPRLRKSLQIIEQTALDAAKTVRRLQDFTRVRVDREFEFLSVNQLVKSALQMVEPRRAERQETGDVEIEISTQLDKVPPVEGNPAELREALLNIIFNAMDAMPQGGKITLKSEQEDSWVVLSISDTGAGIPEEMKGKIFDPFFTTKSPEGIGLGLSVTYGIVTRHGGSIEVDSRPGEGSTFYIRLPVATGFRRRRRPANMISSTRMATILLVDDDVQVSEVLELMLTQLGHRVTVATRGEEAISAFEKGDYDVVITDLGMPDMSGREVARAVKERKRGTPVVLITGWGVQLEAGEMEKIGVDGVIAKPFSREALSAQVAELLGSEN
ncbi:MAG: ATP-binding protein [Dehalococcoidia bacterium]